ncbi:MAG TPA: sialate O-acetylesterase [Chitinophagaceae bacterium]|nr:sialate O-acetylesterase [Chitinophagaceae bacterium]
MKKLSLIYFLLSVLSARANITLPSVIASNMVLQQNASVNLWGWGDPNEKVLITNSWNGKTDSTKVNENAKWQVSINTPSAGGPYTITIKGYNRIVLTNVLIGEVWVSSGQSNMEYSYRWGMPKMKEEFPMADKLNIRFFNIPRTTAEAPQDDCKAQWTLCDSNTLKSFSAVAYYFGKKLNRDLNVPIGLINASWGGTPAETWTPAELVNNDPVLKQAAGKLPVSNGWPITPGYTYNGMLSPIINYTITGAIWYQGEGNTASAATYHQLFSTMINAWRKKWNKEFPFYFVQIAPFRYGNKNVAALIREEQFKTLIIPKTGMVVTTDLAEDTLDIHPKNKKDVGIRLAKLALSGTYHKDVPSAKSPLYKSMEIQKDKAIISFDNTDGLLLKDNIVKGLYIAGDDQRFYPAQALIKDDKLVVWNKSVAKPVAVRYAFSNTAVGNLYSKEQMPVSPFRTDNWNVDTSAQ